jgi:wobble nucleotide-excising tRNase
MTRADHKTRFSKERQPVKNGRPKESRDRISTAFLHDLADSWQKNGAKAIEDLRKADVGSYVRVFAGVIPKEVEVTHQPLENMSEEKLTEAIDMLAEVIRAQAPSAIGNPDDEPEAPKVQH